MSKEPEDKIPLVEIENTAVTEENEEVTLTFDKTEDTTLQQLISSGNVAQLRQFLQQHPEIINQKWNTLGQTSLHFAALEKQEQCLKLLIESGGDLTIEDWRCKSVIDYIFDNFKKPAKFLCKIFDSRVNYEDQNDQKFILDFSILCPNGDRQMPIFQYLSRIKIAKEKFMVLSHPICDLFLRNKANRTTASVLMHLHNIITFGSFGFIVPVVNPDISIDPYIFLPFFLLQIVVGIIQVRFKTIYSWTFLRTIVKITFPVILHFLYHMKATTTHYRWTHILGVTSYTILCYDVTLGIRMYDNLGKYYSLFWITLKRTLAILFGFQLILASAFLFIQPYVYTDKSVIGRISNIIVLTTGEFNYDKYLKDSTDLAKLWFLIFVICTHIVLLNLILSITVKEIDDILVMSKLKCYHTRIDFLTETERVLHALKYRWNNKFVRFWFERFKLKKRLAFEKSRTNKLFYGKLIDSLEAIGCINSRR